MTVHDLIPEAPEVLRELSAEYLRVAEPTARTFSRGPSSKRVIFFLRSVLTTKAHETRFTRGLRGKGTVRGNPTTSDVRTICGRWAVVNQSLLFDGVCCPR